MKLNIAQCRSAKKTGAPRGVRRSARISSSSSSSFRLQEFYAGTHCSTSLPLTTFPSPCKAPCKVRTLKKREVSKLWPLQAEVFDQPQQAVGQTVESLLETQQIDDGFVTARLSKQRSFKQENTRLAKQRSFNLDISTEAGLSRQTSLKIEALIEPRVLSRTSSCTTIGRKRVVGVDDFSQELELPNCSSPSTPSSISEHDFSPRKKFASPRTPSTCLDRSPSASLTLSELECTPEWSFTMPQTPSTPSSRMNLGLCLPEEACSGDSLLEELPFDLLLRIVCCLEHDDLRPVSQVCKRLLRAVAIAQHCHFSFTTPHRERKGKRAQIYLSSEDQMAPQGSLAGTFIRPPTPSAPKHSARPAELRFRVLSPFASCLESPRAVHTIKPPRTGMVLHRVLFDEDELCEAVAQNSL